MSARGEACKHKEKAQATRSSLKVARNQRHEQVVRTAKVKPLPNLRMKVTTRPVVRGRGREPRPQSLAPRLQVVHAQAARVGLLGCCEDQATAPASIVAHGSQPGHDFVGTSQLNVALQIQPRNCLSTNHRPSFDPTSFKSAVRCQACHRTAAPAARQPADHPQPRSGQREGERWPVERAAPFQLW